MIGPMPGKRLPVAGQGSKGSGEGDGNDPQTGTLQSDPGRSRTLSTLVVPALGAVVILSAGFLGQCFGGP